MFTHTDDEERIPEKPLSGAFSHELLDGIVAGAATTWRTLFQTRVIPDDPEGLSDEAERRLILRDLDRRTH